MSEGFDVEFIGYAEAAAYLGMKRNSLSSCVAKGTGPQVHRREIRRQYVLPVFRKSDIDEWVRNRPGQGFRTDMLPATA
jgi:predicted DNA-binding transcriptional regulator AlpA